MRTLQGDAGAKFCREHFLPRLQSLAIEADGAGKHELAIPFAAVTKSIFVAHEDDWRDGFADELRAWAERRKITLDGDPRPIVLRSARPRGEETFKVPVLNLRW